GHFFSQFACKPLRHAAADDEFLTGRFVQATLLVRLQNRLDAFLFGGINERTGVDDENVGILRPRSDFHAALQHAAEHNFCIDEVLRAAKTDHADLWLITVDRVRDCLHFEWGWAPATR